MINKKDITFKTSWCEDSEAYVTECDQFMNVIGCGETIEESEKTFNLHLDTFIESINKGNALIIKNKGGRPKKNNVRLSCNIPEKTKEYIYQKALENNLNPGAMLEKIVNDYRKNEAS